MSVRERVRERYREGRGLLAWLVRNRKPLAGIALRTFADVRELRHGSSPYVEAARAAAANVDPKEPP